jgi:hypothetical protein
MSEQARTIQAQRSQREASGQVWWWITGETYAHRALLKAQGARFSSKRKAWYYIGSELPAAIEQLVAEVETAAPESVMPPELERQILAVLADDDGQRVAEGVVVRVDTAEAEPTARSQITVNKPAPIPVDGDMDPVQAAVRAMTTQKPAPAQSLPVRGRPDGRLTPIGQAFCGEIAGSISGQVYCYGYAVHDGTAVYLNMAGPRMAVEAIRAKLSKGEVVTLVPADSPAIELTAGEGNSGMYHAHLHYLPEARFASLMLIHDWAVMPNYGGKATTFIFRSSIEQAAAKLKHHVTQLVNLPVFDAWSAYLYDAGQQAMLLRKTRSEGGIDLLTVDLDVDAWTRLITGGLAQDIIRLPE